MDALDFRTLPDGVAKQELHDIPYLAHLLCSS